MQIVTNFAVDDVDSQLEIARRAKVAGANTIFLSDTKFNNYGLGQLDGSVWAARARQFIDGVEALDMDIVLNTLNIGYCTEILSDDPNLAAAYPTIDQRFVAKGDRLVPVKDRPLRNGGFESYSGNSPDGWNTDAPGERTFIDTEVVRSGAASLRAESVRGEFTRVSNRFPVKPFQQYSLRFAYKTEDFSSNNLEVLLRDANDGRAKISGQRFSQRASDDAPWRLRNYFSRLVDDTRDWSFMRIDFNSLESTEIDLILANFGGVKGSMWFDNVRIVENPTMNTVVRDTLPRRIEVETSDTLAPGTALEFGRDVTPYRDRRLGNAGYPGNFDNYHRAPQVRIPEGSRIKEGDIVRISDWHTTVTMSGQTGCAWNAQGVQDRAARILQRIHSDFDLDGYMLNFDEIRQGGYDPEDTMAHDSSAEAMRASIQNAFQSMKDATPGARYYFWSDMIDPNHNAVDQFYQINGSLDGVWEGLFDPDEITLVTWWETYQIADSGRASLEFFSDLGYRQIIGAYYDSDVRENHELWQAAADGVPGIAGDMFASWVQDYTQIEAYGALWWSAEN